MNKIETRKRYSIYKIYDIPYDEIYIDDVSLDELIEKIMPNNQIRGLVPATSGWFEDEKDEEIVWERIIPSEGMKSICPILICPDDQDYYCTTIVVEIENTKDRIFWNRFGYNKKYEFRKYATIGIEVDWFLGFERMEFDYSEYVNVMRTIKENRISETTWATARSSV